MWERKSSGRHIVKFQRKPYRWLQTQKHERTTSRQNVELAWGSSKRISFMHMGLSQMEARILGVKFHQKLVHWTKGPGGKGKITSILTVLLWEKGPKRRENLRSAIEEVINSVNKLSCLPKQEDKECSLCLKFNPTSTGLFYLVVALGGGGGGGHPFHKIWCRHRWAFKLGGLILY